MYETITGKAPPPATQATTKPKEKKQFVRVLRLDLETSGR
jgi:hypothetical protein